MIMHRSLQHASLALDKQDNNSSLSFSYAIGGLACLAGAWVVLQFTYHWVCRVYFGREEPVEPLTGEEILAGLSEDQRRAVLETIISKFNKVRHSTSERLEF